MCLWLWSGSSWELGWVQRVWLNPSILREGFTNPSLFGHISIIGHFGTLHVWNLSIQNPCEAPSHCYLSTFSFALENLFFFYHSIILLVVKARKSIRSYAFLIRKFITKHFVRGMYNFVYCIFSCGNLEIGVCSLFREKVIYIGVYISKMITVWESTKLYLCTKLEIFKTSRQLYSLVSYLLILRAFQ